MKRRGFMTQAVAGIAGAWLCAQTRFAPIDQPPPPPVTDGVALLVRQMHVTMDELSKELSAAWFPT